MKTETKWACLLLRAADRQRAAEYLSNRGVAVTEKLEPGIGFLLAETELLPLSGTGLLDSCRL